MLRKKQKEIINDSEFLSYDRLLIDYISYIEKYKPEFNS